MPDILPKDTTPNTPPSGITISDYGTNYNAYYQLPRSDSESEGHTGIDVPSYFLPEGSSLPPQVAT